MGLDPGLGSLVSSLLVYGLIVFERFSNNANQQHTLFFLSCFSILCCVKADRDSIMQSLRIDTSGTTSLMETERIVTSGTATLEGTCGN